MYGIKRTGRVPWNRVMPLAAAWCLAASLMGQGKDPVVYELLSGSTLVDDCLECERPTVILPISGTFVLQLEESIPGAMTYRVSDLVFSDDRGGYTGSGSGLYRRLTTFPPAHELELNLTIDGVDGIELSAEVAVAETPWPGIEIEVGETGERDPLHVYTLYLIAAPRPLTWKPYELVEGSTFLEDCHFCDRPAILVDVGGTFRLGDPGPAPSPIITYVVDDLSVDSLNPELEYRLTGSGVYVQGGEVALMQEGGLVLQVNQMPGLIFASEPTPPPSPWPAIEIEFVYDNGFTIYTLKLVARPVEPSPVLFRRGDANADSVLDIADAIFTLSYLFADGPAPPCLDAADANDDGAVDIADAIAVLSHLFAGAGPLPEPFGDCGVDPTIDELGCSSYEPCE